MAKVVKSWKINKSPKSCCFLLKFQRDFCKNIQGNRVQGNSKAEGTGDSKTQDTGKDEAEGNHVEMDSGTRYTAGIAAPEKMRDAYTTNTR